MVETNFKIGDTGPKPIRSVTTPAVRTPTKQEPRGEVKAGFRRLLERKSDTGEEPELDTGLSVGDERESTDKKTLKTVNSLFTAFEPPKSSSNLGKTAKTIGDSKSDRTQKIDEAPSSVTCEEDCCCDSEFSNTSLDFVNDASLKTVGENRHSEADHPGSITSQNEPTQKQSQRVITSSHPIQNIATNIATDHPTSNKTTDSRQPLIDQKSAGKSDQLELSSSNFHDSRAKTTQSPQIIKPVSEANKVLPSSELAKRSKPIANSTSLNPSHTSSTSNHPSLRPQHDHADFIGEVNEYTMDDQAVLFDERVSSKNDLTTSDSRLTKSTDESTLFADDAELFEDDVRNLADSSSWAKEKTGSVQSKKQSDLSSVNPANSALSSQVLQPAILQQQISSTHSSSIATTQSVLPTQDVIALSEEIAAHIASLHLKDRVDTAITLKNPPIFEGAQIVIQQHKSAAGELSISFYNLSNQAASLILDQHNQALLRENLKQRGLNVHILQVSQASNQQTLFTTEAQSATFKAKDREGGESRSGDSKERRERRQR